MAIKLKYILSLDQQPKTLDEEYIFGFPDVLEEIKDIMEPCNIILDKYPDCTIRICIEGPRNVFTPFSPFSPGRISYYDNAEHGDLKHILKLELDLYLNIDGTTIERIYTWTRDKFYYRD